MFSNDEEGVVLSKVLFILGEEEVSGRSDIAFPYYIIDSDGRKHFNEQFSIYSTGK